MNKTKFFMIKLLIICHLFTSCGSQANTYLDVRNYTITSLDVRENKIIMEGRLNSSLVIVDSYVDRIEDNMMFIKIYLTYPKRSNKKNMKDDTVENQDNSNAIKHLSIYFEQSLPDNIEKIFIEDEENKIMVWDKSQGYRSFQIENSWIDELKKLNQSFFNKERQKSNETDKEEVSPG